MLRWNLYKLDEGIYKLRRVVNPPQCFIGITVFVEYIAKRIPLIALK